MSASRVPRAGGRAHGRRQPLPRYLSYLDESSGGPENDFANRNISFMTHNLMHTASMLRRVGGFPAYGNQRAAWDAGCSPDNANPEHR